ncbi:MAG: hypothetical protein K8S56_08460 [Candidatus Cloacimonetes bacterium]|nr:hypothetical protein [Candidatus Cloacimonadota bacterium]
MHRVGLFVLAILLLAGCSAGKVAHKERNRPNYDALHLYSMAETAVQMKDYSLGFAYMLKAAQATPENKLIRERMMQLLLRSGFRHRDVLEQALTFGKTFEQENLLTPEAMRIYGQALIADNQVKKGIAYYHRAVEDNPSAMDYYRLFLYEQNLLDNTVPEYLAKATELSRDNPLFLMSIAVAYSRFDEAKAIEVMEAAYEINRDEQTYRKLVSVYKASKNLKKLEQLIAARMESGLPVLDNDILFRAQMLYQADNFSEIVSMKDELLRVGGAKALKLLFWAVYDDARQDLVQTLAQTILDSLTLASEERAFYHATLSEIYYLQNEQEKATEHLFKCGKLKYIDEVFQAIIKSAETDTTETQTGLMEIVDTMREQGMLANHVHWLRAVIWGNTNAFGETSEELAKISNDYIYRENLTTRTADLYIRSGDHESALRLIKEAPEDSEFRKKRMLSFYYDITGNDSLSAYYLFEDLQLHTPPDTTEIFTLASKYELLKKYDTEIEVIQFGLQYYPESPYLLNWLGYLKLIRTDDISGAEVLIKKAYRKSPGSLHIIDSMAWLYHLKGKTGKGYKLLVEALPDTLSDSVLAYHLGVMAHTLRKTEEARFYLNIAIELDNDDEAVRDAKRILGSE